MARKHLHSYIKAVLFRGFNCRNLSSTPAAAPELDMFVRQDIENEEIKPRKHPGVMKLPTCSLPEDIVKAVSIVTEEVPVKTLLNDAKMLTNYMMSRHYPWDEEDLAERKQRFVGDVKSRMGELPPDASQEQVSHYTSLVKYSVQYLMTKYQYRWSPLDLHQYSSMVYLFTRAAPNYAATLRVLNEITKLCPDYRPTNLLDFGSGIGSTSWAAKTCFGDSLKEYVNIDSSSSINDLASMLLQGGRQNEASPPQGVYYRAFLPAQHKKYSIVVSGHSLMELPSRESRLSVLLNLWQKTKDFLIVVEQGTKAGFKVVVEARDFILSLSNEEDPAHVFAPCPHDAPCPRFLRGPNPCHFQVLYFDLPVGKKQEIKKELISYIIMRRGRRTLGNDWPRVVRPVLKRHNHVICRMCTAHGDLQEIIFTKNKHDKTLYKCAKVTRWGDRLPVKLAALGAEEVPAQDDCLDNTNLRKPDGLNCV